MVIIVIIVATSMLVVTKMVTGWSLEMIDVNCLEMAITLAARMAATRLRADISLKLVISDRQLSLSTVARRSGRTQPQHPGTLDTSGRRWLVYLSELLSQDYVH